MIHFREHFGLCSQAKEGDVISTTSSISTYRLLCAESPLFCQECAGYDDERTDSERYAELRKLVDVGKQFPPRLERKPFTARSLVGMTQGARKRLREAIFCGERVPPFILGADSVTEGLRIGKRLRPCPGCFHCQPGVKGWHIDRSRSGRFNMPALALHCDGIGVLPARKQK